LRPPPGAAQGGCRASWKRISARPWEAARRRRADAPTSRVAQASSGVAQWQSSLTNLGTFGFIGSGGGGGGGGAGDEPQSATIDESCASVPALTDPQVIAQALTLITLQARNDREFGFFSAPGNILRLNSRYNGAPFSSPGEAPAVIRARDLNSNYFGEGWTTEAPDLFIHSHLHRGIGGQPGDGDFRNAAILGGVDKFEPVSG